MAEILPFTDDVLPHLAKWRREGTKTALVTLVGIDGSSPRPLGSQMVVAEDGRSVGVITGGCAQAAIIAEATGAMETGANRLVRFGEGSPYMDIKLPCGAGIDVHVELFLSDDDLAALMDARRARRPLDLTLNLEARGSQSAPTNERGMLCERVGARFRRRYLPLRRLVAAGKGPAVAALSQMACVAGLEVICLSPEEETLALSEAPGVETRILSVPAAFPDSNLLDPWTALAVLFHDHDWEPEILEKALRSECFYIGALGSRRTHRARLEILQERGWKEDALKRIHGPVGLDIGAKSPPDIAVSILAEIVASQKGLW